MKIYYSYLPATFIYKNFSYNNLKNLPADYIKDLWPIKTDKGYYALKMTMGMAILYSPFFFIAHSLAKPLGYKRDGFTLPYRFAIAMGCVFYLAIGLYFLSRVLERYFSQ